jgi:Putative auto-transporter adhesin, head GIN domain
VSKIPELNQILRATLRSGWLSLAKPTHMKNLVLSASFLLLMTAGYAQTESKSLSSFKNIVASPHISVILTKGDKESIRLVYNNISPERVNVLVKGKTLHLFLDHARVAERHFHRRNVNFYGNKGMYEGVSVTAYVTYTALKTLEIRGDGEISCEDAIVADKFKLRAFGENEIRLSSLKTKKFKASLYGENDVKILSGEANRQVFRLFGENKIDNRGLCSATVSVRVFGEGKLSLNATDEVHFSAFGEPVISVTGNPVISRGIVIGHTSIWRD